MVRIRLMRVGKRKQPSYRVVVADARSPRDGRIIEAIGHYEPRQEPSGVSIDADRARYWIERGAQPSNQVRKLLDIASGAAQAPAATVAPARTPPKKATPAESVEAGETPDEAQPTAETPEESGDQAASEDEPA